MGIEPVRVTGDADNTPAVRVVEKNGGILDGEVVSTWSQDHSSMLDLA